VDRRRVARCARGRTGHDGRAEKGEAMISMAVKWTADVLRQMIAEA
jgi:hypothetical protein